MTFSDANITSGSKASFEASAHYLGWDSVKALESIRVLDLSNVLAGPFCGYHLARLGAEVIKIENPRGGDLARRLGADPAMSARLQGLSFVSVNAGKQSVALDLKTEEGKAVFLRLVEETDVVIENFRPGVMDRLGLGYAILSRINPKLIYCSISGFGQTGPWASRPAYDQIIQGLSGAMSVTGDANSAPLRTGFPLADAIGGMTAAFAIAAALVRQRTTQEGERIDVSMLESTLAAMGWVVSNNLNAGVDPQPIGNDNFTAAPSGTFRTGRGLLNIAANGNKQFEVLCDLLGRADLRRDPRFAHRESRRVNRGALTQELELALSHRTAAEWETVLNESGVPAGRVLSVPEVMNSAHVRQRGFVETIDAQTTEGEPVRVTRPGFLFSEPFAAVSPPAELGADTEKWMQRFGFTPDQIAAVLSAIDQDMP